MIIISDSNFNPENIKGILYTIDISTDGIIAFIICLIILAFICSLTYSIDPDALNKVVFTLSLMTVLIYIIIFILNNWS
jgi:hypothetical protein